MEYVDHRPLTAGSIFLSTIDNNFAEEEPTGESKNEGEEEDETEETEERQEETKRDEYYLSSSEEEQGSDSDASEQV